MSDSFLLADCGCKVYQSGSIDCCVDHGGNGESARLRTALRELVEAGELMLHAWREHEVPPQHLGAKLGPCVDRLIPALSNAESLLREEKGKEWRT